MNAPRAFLALLVAGALLSGGTARAQGTAEPPEASPPPPVVSPTTEPRAPVGPRLDLHGFFDINVSARRIHSTGVDSTEFQSTLGQFDLYMLSRLSERISFLGELVIEGESATGTRLDLERAHLRYSLADWLQLTAGRTHSPISLWNVVYHHGALLEPTTGRPAAVEFEDEGGLLPLHAVGVEFAGHVPVGTLQLQYTASMSNGRGPTPDEVQTSSDRNRDKALGATFGVQFEQPFNIVLGTAFHHDRLPASDDGRPEFDQDIWGAHLSSRTNGLDLIAESFVVRDRDRATGASYRQRAWYAVVSSGGGRWHPYLAADRMTVDSRDAYFAPSLRTLQRATAGLRLDVSEANVVKLEYRNALRDGFRSHELILQTAFTF